MRENLLLYQRPLAGEGFLGNYTEVARKWRREVLAVAGFGMGSFELSQEDLTRSELVDFYNMNMGCVVGGRTYGMESWDSMIWEMRLVQDGAESFQTLKKDTFHNRIKVLYSSDIGERAETAWVANTDSSDIYGVCNMIISLGGATATDATNKRDRNLTSYAWPRSRRTGGGVVEGGEDEAGLDRLVVTVAGRWATMNWVYRETSETDAVSDLLETLVGETEFVTVRRVESNADSVRADAYPIPRQIGDLCREKIEEGGSGNVWRGGVFEGGKFVYEQAPTTWTYKRRGSALLDKADGPVILPLFRPGVLVYDEQAPTGWPRPGVAGDWDNPRVHYVERVEYIAGDARRPAQLLMKYADVDESVAVIENVVGKGVGAGRPVGEAVIRLPSVRGRRGTR